MKYELFDVDMASYFKEALEKCPEIIISQDLKSIIYSAKDDAILLVGKEREMGIKTTIIKVELITPEWIRDNILNK